jgi:hypothetical protein
MASCPMVKCNCALVLIVTLTAPIAAWQNIGCVDGSPSETEHGHRLRRHHGNDRWPARRLKRYLGYLDAIVGLRPTSCIEYLQAGPSCSAMRPKRSTPAGGRRGGGELNCG